MNPEDADDSWLIQECLRGNTAAFAILTKRYEGRLFKSVSGLMGSPDEAEDVVQETFINAFQSLSTFKYDAHFYTWLYRLAYNIALNHRRGRGFGGRLSSF